MVTRDFLLVFSKKIKNSIIIPTTKKYIRNIIKDDDFFKSCLQNILNNFLDEKNKNIFILMNNDNKNEIIEFFTHKIFKKILENNKINFGFTDEFEGFKIIKKDDKLIWDFTVETLTQEVSKIIEPHLIKYFIQ